ncbi:hypothetical protein K466DRAFT_469313, partial [Polyporus arcularius HHB13444]
RSRTRAAAAPADTGRAETSREFAKRIHRVVLHGPRGERQEGVRPVDELEKQTQHIDKVLPAEYEPVDPPMRQESQFMQYLSENTNGLDLLEELKGRYDEDPFFARITANPKHYKNFVLADGLIFIRDAQKRLLCVPDVRINGRSAREIMIRHAHTLLAHLGAHRTACLLRDHVWWKT